MPEVTDATAKKAFQAYAKAHFKLENVQPTELELKGMKAALQFLADVDEAFAEHHMQGKTKGSLTMMIFDGSDLWAIGKDLTTEEVRDFCRRVLADDH